MLATQRRRIIRSMLATAAIATGVAASADAHAAGTAGTCGVITYCGGPVIANVQIQPVFWTSQVRSSITGWAEGYLSSIANSELLDMLSEYSTAGKTSEVCTYVDPEAGLVSFGPKTPTSTGQTITRGTALPAVTITPTNTSTDLVDDDATIGKELVAQIAAGKLPAPTYDAQGYPNTLYFVFFPDSYNITLTPYQSCSGFGGYHYSVPYGAGGACAGKYVPYAVIPDCGSGSSGLASVCSHELAEAVTDADVGPTTATPSVLGDGAWYLGPSYPCSDPQTCPQNCGEVGDVCQGHGDATVPGSSVTSQEIWSQAQNGCHVSNASIGQQAPPATPPVTVCAEPADASAPPVEAGPPPEDAGAPKHDAGGGGGGPGTPAPDAGGTAGRDAGSGGPTTGPADDAGSAANGGLGDAPFASSSGCGCSTAPRQAGAMGLLGAAVAAGLVARRRRRG